MLPKGVKPDPTEEELKEWYFKTYSKSHRHAYITSGVGKDDLQNSTKEQITDYMRLLHQSDMQDGTIARMMLANERNRNGSRTRDGHEKPHRSNARYSSKRSDERWDRRRDGSPPSKSYRSNDSSKRRERNRGPPRRNDRRDDRKGRGYSSRREGRDDKSDRRGKPEFYRSDRKDCKIHRPCKHTWAECSQNPRNQRAEAHHQDDAPSDASNSHDDDDRSASDSRSESGSDAAEAHHVHDDGLYDSDEYRIPRRNRKVARKPKGKKKKRAPAKKQAPRGRILEDSEESSEERDEFSGIKA